MKGKITNQKGTLIESLFELSNGQFLTIQPLFDDIAVIIVKPESSGDFKIDKKLKENTIVSINHLGEIVGEYTINGTILSVSNTVLYPNGQMWSGNIMEGQENEIEYILLTEESISLLKDSTGFSFDDADIDNRPTVLVKLKDSIRQKCGTRSHGCRTCRKIDKFIKNGLTDNII